ncbi:AI-2E family transporter [Paenibacillus sp. TRM 82003]|uniref:AI-2E family transporter n=1 Tax=Kineococcus sp. TRM81007 TaxID=2925831 RepID=UPI001F56F85C|nr:AI-2E family transporter [Kineococcus sp. TRM81007]MCI2238599.1 AI-2E family transporter [Kineococcus sp. TRM81007]MCI3927261.1 AI-2E family transporter [Paenibacillus sp. TRM 82003]
MSDPTPPPAAQNQSRTVNVVERGIAEAAKWTLRLLVIGIGVAGLLWLLGKGWSLLLPLLLAVLLSAILWPLASLLRAVLPRAIAALLSILILVALVTGIFAALIPSVAGQFGEVADSAVAGIQQVQDWINGPPLNLGEEEIGDLVNQGLQELQSNAQNIALGVVGGVGTVGASIGSGVITFLLVLVLTFFCLSDGDRLLPWSRRWLDANTHHHATELGTRVWATIRGYILSQAAVAFVDAFFIGIGLWIIGVPFALPLAVTIFFAAFIPIVGAVVTGVLATLVALVTLGWVEALIVLGIVLLVQQLEGNVLQPLLVGKTLALHPAVVIGAVTIGGTLFGIIGAFLAVPVAAILTVVLRYVHHVLLPDEPENPAEEHKEKKNPLRRDPAVAEGQPAATAAAKGVQPDDRS